MANIYYHVNESNIDITTFGINKGTACVDLLQKLGFMPHEVDFVFNDKNDLPIVEHKLLKNLITIKVGNLLPEINVTYSVATPFEVSTILHDIILNN